jgi:hypothetical protein
VLGGVARKRTLSVLVQYTGIPNILLLITGYCSLTVYFPGAANGMTLGCWVFSEIFLVGHARINQPPQGTAASVVFSIKDLQGMLAADAAAYLSVARLPFPGKTPQETGPAV